MSRYIDADHLIERATNPYGDWWASTCESTSDFVDYINEEPTADVKPIVYGEWIETCKGLIVTDYKCSICGRTVRDDTGYDVTVDYPYCNCGADMRKESEEEE